MKFEQFWERWHPTYDYCTNSYEWKALELEMYENLIDVINEYMDDFQDYRKRREEFKDRCSVYKGIGKMTVDEFYKE